MPQEIVQEAFNGAETFFAQTPKVKDSVRLRHRIVRASTDPIQVDISKSENFRGYMKLLSENANPFVGLSGLPQ